MTEQDRAILDAAKEEETSKVAGGGNATGAPQSHDARAWTMNGNVD
jgi:hypothetical protein